MKTSDIVLLSAIILLAITTSALYIDVNTRSANPQPINPIPVATSNQKKVPLIYYQTNVIHANHTLGNVSLPLRFTLVGKQSQIGTKTRSFSTLFNAGDEVEFWFNSSQTVDFTIYAPGVSNVTGNPSSDKWYSENTTQRSSRLIALKAGVYNFTFTTNAPQTIVTFDAGKIRYDLRDVLFMKSEGVSGSAGGISVGSFYSEPLPGSFIVGRSWYNSIWTDRSYSFSTTLDLGTVITYGYNATEPISFSLASDSGTLDKHNDLYSYRRTYSVPSTGKYTFSFDLDQPNTAIVSFRCRASSPVGYGDQATALDEETMVEGVRSYYSFPPAINATTTIVGKLGSSTYPTQQGKLMIIKPGNSTKSYLLHLGSPSEFIIVNIEGYTMLGNVSLTDLRDAYDGNSTIRVTGFPFQLSLNGVVYDMFHVNTAKILGAYPLYAQQSAVLASGSVNDILNGTRQYFPLTFNIGFYSFSGSGQTIVGVPQVFYNCYMKEGATVKISYNATNPVEFGFYRDGYGFDSPVINSFELSKPSDYVFRESGVQNFNHLYTVPRSGFYTFAFKLLGDKDATVVLDATMVK